MTNKSIKNESRIDWHTKTNQVYIGDENIKLGCLMRIADATELMAKNHVQLVADHDYYKSRLQEEQAAVKRMANRIRGLQSAITRLKNKI